MPRQQQRAILRECGAACSSGRPPFGACPLVSVLVSVAVLQRCVSVRDGALWRVLADPLCIRAAAAHWNRSYSTRIPCRSASFFRAESVVRKAASSRRASAR